MIRSIVSLLVSVFIILAVYWCAMWYVAVVFNGGMGEVQAPSSFITIGLAFLGAGLVLCLIALVKPLQKMTIATQRAANFKRFPFIFIGVLFLIIAGLLIWPQVS